MNVSDYKLKICLIYITHYRLTIGAKMRLSRSSQLRRPSPKANWRPQSHRVSAGQRKPCDDVRCNIRSCNTKTRPSPKPAPAQPLRDLASATHILTCHVPGFSLFVRHISSAKLLYATSISYNINEPAYVRASRRHWLPVVCSAVREYSPGS